jgi:hypothetical protein
VTEYVAPFDRVRTHDPVLICLGDVEEHLGVEVVDLNVDRVGNEERSLRVVIYPPMSGTNSMDLNLLTRIGIL